MQHGNVENAIFDLAFLRFFSKSPAAGESYLTPNVFYFERNCFVMRKKS